MIKHCTSKFSTLLDKNLIVAEASDLGRNWFDRIYQDAVDAGFTLVSRRTGAETVWYLNHDRKDQDGDTVSWVFFPTNETLRKQPHLKTWTVEVFND